MCYDLGSFGPWWRDLLLPCCPGCCSVHVPVELGRKIWQISLLLPLLELWQLEVAGNVVLSFLAWAFLGLSKMRRKHIVIPQTPVAVPEGAQIPMGGTFSSLPLSSLLHQWGELVKTVVGDYFAVKWAQAEVRAVHLFMLGWWSDTKWRFSSSFF